MPDHSWIQGQFDEDNERGSDYVAEYEGGGTLDVVRWNSDGEAEVVIPREGRLTPANTLSGFVTVRQAQRPRREFIPAAPGWTVKLSDGTVKPIAAWNMIETGTEVSGQSSAEVMGVPITANDTGFAYLHSPNETHINGPEV